MAWIETGVAFGVSLVLGTIGTQVSKTLAVSLGIISHPNPIVPQHKVAIAYLGGLGIALGAIASWVLLQTLGPPYRQWQPGTGLIVGSILFLAVGICDDLLRLRPTSKIILQTMAALISASLGVSVALPSGKVSSIALSCLWMVGIVNAANLIDVCDGLLAGLSLVAFIFFAVLNSATSYIAILLAGTCLGFLVFNLPPARIFLGDAGSHLLGFLLAFCTLSEAAAHPSFSTYAAMALILGVPLFEMIFLIVVRTRKRLPFWRGSPDHFALRMQAAGLSRLQTNLIAAAIMVLFCGIAWALLRHPSRLEQALLIAIAGVIAGTWWCFLLRHEVVCQAP
jgi:UDP-GlcNAc:undecaprenyl-phosphate GlcNAc-1-phosphate transferase